MTDPLPSSDATADALRQAQAALAASLEREAALKATIDFQNRLLNAIADPVFIKDEQHRWVEFNDAFCGFIGQPRSALLGKSDYDFFPRAEADEFRRCDDVVLETGEENINEEALTDARGERHVIATRKSRYVDGHGHRFLVGVIRDITERTRMEQALRQQNEQLKEYDRLKNSFVDSVSHELRTPLTSVVGYAEFLEDEIGGQLSEAQRAFVRQILEGGHRLQLLVDDLLDFARLSSGAFKLSCRPVDLREIARSALESLRPQARERSQALELALPELPVMVEADPARISQVLVNLIGNAIKFSPEGGRVGVGLLVAGETARIEVEDTGPGIPAEHLGRVFDRFYQVDGRSTREQGGVGLGLAIARTLVEAHGGQVGVETEAGSGCRFWVELPRIEAGADA